MAEVNWINGNILPKKSGEYHIILEVQHDIGDLKKGDIEITNEYFYADKGEWETIGKDNPTWKVLSWANIVKPNIPKDLRDKVKVYFGVKIGEDDE